jgi:GMP synthase (glutamine-hydrolysing)
VVTSPSVLVIQHSKRGGPRRLGEWLAEDGVTVDVVHAYDGAPVPSDNPHDALLVLGGGFMPDDDARAPWLKPTRGLVEQALEAGTPMLGICLGGQMLAHVAGGSVQADAGAPENGSLPITLRPEAAADPLLHDLPATVTAIEHHVDAITALPPEAVWLASTERCPYQAFRVGEAAWGVQFHPEVDADRLLEWDHDRLRAQGFDKDELYRQAVADEPVAKPIWREVATRFAAQITSSVDRRRESQ